MKHWPLLVILTLGTLGFYLFTAPTVRHQRYAYGTR